MTMSALIDAGAAGWSPHAPRFTAVVHAPDGIRFVAAAASEQALFERLSGHVLANAEYQLWPGDAIAVVDMLRRGEHEAAVERYFSSVGSRWDVEWLVCADSHAC